MSPSTNEYQDIPDPAVYYQHQCEPVLTFPRHHAVCSRLIVLKAPTLNAPSNYTMPPVHTGGHPPYLSSFGVQQASEPQEIQLNDSLRNNLIAISSHLDVSTCLSVVPGQEPHSSMVAALEQVDPFLWTAVELHLAFMNASSLGLMYVTSPLLRLFTIR